jgi:hypothetical protein
MGIYRYAAAMSDFQRVKGLSDRNSSGCDAWNSLMESPRILMPSSLTSAIDCQSVYHGIKGIWACTVVNDQAKLIIQRFWNNMNRNDIHSRKEGVNGQEKHSAFFSFPH